MASGVHIQEPVLDTLRREDEHEKLMDQASTVTLSNILVEGNLGASHAVPVEPPGTLETGFEMKDSVEGNEGRASTVEGEKFLKSPSAAEVHFEENNLGPDACQVTKNEKKTATENETDIWEARLDAEESNGLQKGLVSALEVAATREVDHGKSIPADEAELPENKEDRESLILEKEAAPMESLNANPEDTNTCDTVHDTETTSLVEKKSMESTSQELPYEKVEHTTPDTNQETLESISTIVPKEKTEKNLSIGVDDSQMKTDEELEEEDEKPEPTLIPEVKIKDGESMQNELFEAKNDTETVIRKYEEVIEKGVESSPEAASEAEDIKASTSDQDTNTSALENQIPTENPEDGVDKSECKPEKETPKELMITKHEAHLGKESEKPCFTGGSTTDSSHDETTPVDKAKNEDQEPIKSDLFENKEDTERTILVEEPIVEKHFVSLNAAPDDITACDLVQDTETKSSTKEELLTSTPLDIRGDEIEQTSFNTKEELPEDISTSVSNQETEEDSIVEVPVPTEALTTDNDLAVTEGEVKDEDQREKNLLENNNDTGSELLKQEVTVEPVEFLQLATEAEDTEVSTLDHDPKIGVLEYKILTENSREIVADETDASMTMEASHDETTPVDKAKNEDQEPIKSDLFENKEDTENTIPVEAPIVEKHLEYLNAAPDVIKACDLVQDTETKNSTKEELLTAIPHESRGDEIEQTSFNTKEETPEDISTNVSNEETEQNSIVEVPVLTEASTTDNDLAVTEGEVKDENQREKDLLENNNDTGSELLKQEVTAKPIEFLQLATEAEDTEVSTLDHDTKISVFENKILTENRREIVADETDASMTMGASHDETTTVHKAKSEDQEPIKSDLLENKEDTESTIPVEEPIVEKHLESLNAAPDDIKACDLVQDTETKSSTNEEFLTAIPHESRGDEIEQTSFNTKEETPEDISTNVSNEETEQNSIVEVPVLIEALTTDNDLAVTEGKVKDENQREKDLLENNNDTGSELLKQEVTVKPVKFLQLATEAEDTEVSTLDHDTKISVLENKILTENPREIVADETDASVTMGASHDETTSVHKAKSEDQEPIKSDLLENKEDTESTIPVEEPIVEKHLESLNAAPDDIKTCDLVQDTETKSSTYEEFLTAIPHESRGDEIEQTSFNTKEETPEDISTNVSNEETEQNSIVEVQVVKEASATDNELAITEGEIKDENQREKDLLENNNDTVIELLKQELTEKPAESLQLDIEAEDTTVSTSDNDTEISTLENQILSEKPREIGADETESKPCDIVDKKKETLDVQDALTVESNDENEENLVIEEDESEKPLPRAESTRDAADENEGKDQRRAEMFKNPNNAESTSLIEDDTIPKLVDSPQVDTGNIKSHVFDQDAGTTGLILASEGKSSDGESVVKHETETKDDDQKEDQLCNNEKNPESNALLEASQIETPIESLQETLPSTVPRGFLDDETEEKTVDAIQKDREIPDVQNGTKTVTNEKIEENAFIQMDGSKIRYEESSEQEYEIPSLIEAPPKHANIDELEITNEDTIEHEDLREVDLLESKKDTEINLQKNEVQTATHIEPLQVAARDIIASDSYQGTETANSQEERIPSENEIMHEQTEDKRSDTAHTRKESPETLDVSTSILNDDNEEKLVIGEDDSEMKDEENLGKESENPSFIEASLTDASGDESTKKCADKIEGEEQTRAEDTESTSLSKEKTSTQPFESPRGDVEDIKVHVSDQAMETAGLAEVLEGVAHDDEPEVKRIEVEDQNKVELCDTENITDSALLLEAAQMEKHFEPTKVALPTSVSQGFLDENIEEKVTTTVSKENIEDNSLLQVDGSQIQRKENSEQGGEITSISEASTTNINDDNSVDVHEDSSEHGDLRKDEFGDTKITSQKEEAQVEMPAKSSNIAAEDIIASDSCQETETMSSQEKRTLNEEETMCEQIEFETLDTADPKTQTSEAHVVTTIVPNDDSGENSTADENELQMKNEDAFGKEPEKQSITEATMTDASGDGSANKCEDKVEAEEQTRAELFEDQKNGESKFLKEEETMVKLVESPHVDQEDIKMHVLGDGTETTCIEQASEGDADINESAVKHVVKTRDNKKNEDELSGNEKKPKSTDLLEAAQTEKPIESLQETLPSTVPQGFRDDNSQEKTVDTIQKDEDLQNVTATVSHEKIEENSLIQMDGSQKPHEEHLEKEHEIPSVEATTKHASDDELILHEDNIEHEDLRKVELLESEKDTEINNQEEKAQIEMHSKSSQAVAEDIIASDPYQGTETTDSQEERILNANETAHEETEVERLDAGNTKKETPDALDVSTSVLNDDNEENLVIGEDDSEAKDEENLGKESKNPSFIEASPTDTSGDESTKKCEDNIEGDKQARDENTESILLKEAETVALLLDFPQVDAEDTKTYVLDQGTETTGLVEVFEEVADDNRPEVKFTIKTEDNNRKEDELCDNEKIPSSTLLPEVGSLKEASPTLVPQGFLDEKTEEKTIDATEKDEETHETQNVTTIVSNENIEDGSLLQVDGSQTQCKEGSEEETKRPPIIEASTKNINGDDSINIHVDPRKDELLETREDTKITPQKEEAEVEMTVKAWQVSAEDIIESYSCQETEPMSSQERISNDEDIERVQIEVETLDTADKKTKTPEAQDVSTIVPNDVSEANSLTLESDLLQVKNEENMGKESGKPSVVEASTMDASSDESTNTRQDKIEGEEQMGAAVFENGKESTLLKEEEILVKLDESPHAVTEITKTYASDDGAETTGEVEALEGNADDDESAVKYEVKTEDSDKKEDELCDNEKNPESGVLMEAAQTEKPIKSLQETQPSTVPQDFLDDKTEEKTIDAIEKDKEILHIQNVEKTVSNEKIEDNSLIQMDDSQIRHEDNLEEERKTPSVIEASTKHADDDELISIHEDDIESKNLIKVELFESEKDTEIETPVNSLQVAAEDSIASDSYHGTETTSQEEKLLNEIVCKQTEVERLDTADSDKETPEAQNFATIIPSENIKENSQTLEYGSEPKQEELFEKESKEPPLTETLTMEANDEVPEIIHQDQTEDEKLEIVDKLECDKHIEIVLSNEKAPSEKLNEEAKEDLEDIKDIVSGACTTERSLIEAQSQNENQQEIVGNQMEENIVDNDPEKTEDEHLEKYVMFENETQKEISFTKEEESVRNLQESEKKDLEEIKASASHIGTETKDSIEERDLTEISQESVGDQSDDKITAKAQEIQDSTPTVLGEHAENNSPIQPDGSQTKHELSVKECETLPTPEASYLYSSSNQPTTIDVDSIENEHLNKAEKFEDEKHTESAKISYQAPVEEPILEEDKAFVSEEGAETSSMQEQCLTKVSPEGVIDQLEEKIFDKIGSTREFTKSVSDDNGEDIPLLMPVYGSQIKHEELLEKESEISPLSETSLRNFDFNESTVLHLDKIEDELLNRVDKFESEKLAEISLLKEEGPLAKLNDSSLRKDLEEIKKFDLSEDSETSSTGERNLTAVPQGNDFTSVDASQIKHDDLLEREIETPPMPLLHSSNGNSILVHTGKFEDGILENADKFESMESDKAVSLNEELSAEKLTESSKDLMGIEEPIIGDGTKKKSSTEEPNLTTITGDGTETTSSTEEPNLTTISGEIEDDQVEEKVLDAVGEASDLTAVVPDNNTDRNLLVEVDASPIKHEVHLEQESAMPSLWMLKTSTEEPAIVHENEVMGHTEIILSNEEALENSSKEENENIKGSVLCEDTEISIEPESLIVNTHEIVGDHVKERTIDVAQNTPDLTTITSDENVEENSLIQLDGSQIKHEEPLENESETPSTSMLDILGRVIDDQDLREVDKFEHEKDTEATLLEEPTLEEKVTKSVKDDLGDTEVFIPCKNKEITSSIEEQSQKSNHQEIVVDQTQADLLDSAQDIKQPVSHENAGENSLIQADKSQVKDEILSDQTQENVLDTAPKDQDFKPAISHENAEENALIHVHELQMKHLELEKQSDTPSLLIVDTSNDESRIIHEDITEDENLKKIHDFECEKHEEITSKEEETKVTKVNESLNEDLEDIKVLVSGEDSETTSLKSLKENPGEIFSDQLEEKILDIAPAAQDSMIQEDGSQMVHEEISEKEGETPSLSAALIPNTTSEDSTVIHKNKIENEDKREVDIFECEKHVDGDILDAAPEAPESKVVAFDENTEEKSSNQVDETETKHEELLEKKSETQSLSETSLLNTRNEDLTLNDDKIKDKYPEKVDELDCEQHTEFPLTMEEAPLQKLNNPLKEDIEEIKAFVSCLDTETTSSTEDQSLQINPQEVTGDQTEEDFIDATPEPQNVTSASDENTKEKLSLDVDEPQIKHELHENGDEKPSSSILKTSNQESSFIRDSKTENEDVKRNENVEQLNDSPKEGPENIEVPVPSENLGITSPVEERSLTENPLESLTEDKMLDVVQEARESKTTVSDKNIEEDSFILEDGSQMNREEHSEKKNKMPTLTETSTLNTRNEEPTLFLNDKIEDEDKTEENKSECEKHAEITEVLVENLNSSNVENIEVLVSCKDIETTDTTPERSPIVNPTENVGCENVEKALDKAPEAPEFTPTVPDDNTDDNSLIQVDGSQMKHEDILEKGSEVPSLLETSLLNTNNEEPATIQKDIIEDESLKNVDEFESNKCSEANKLEEDARVEESIAFRDIKASASYQDTEAGDLQEQIPTAKPQDMLGNRSEDKFIDTADTKEKITEHNLMVSNENGVQDSSLQIDSEVKHEEISERERKVPCLTKTSTVETNEELKIIPEDMTGEESEKTVESTLVKEGSQVYESVESLKEASKDIKASVSCQNTDTTSSILNTDPQEIAGDQTDDKTNTAGTREITLEELVSNENNVLDSIIPCEELEIKHEEILEKEKEVPFLTKPSMLVDNKELTIIHEDTIEGENLKIVDIFGSAKQTEEEAHLDETMESLEVVSEHIKESISCQDTDPTGSFEEQNLNTTPLEFVGDQVEQKVADKAKTREKTPEVSSSILAFHEDAANRTGADNSNNVMTKDEETSNRYTSSNAAENDEMCASDKVQAKEEEKEMVSKTEIDERANQDDTWIKLPEEDQTCIEVREIDFSSHAEDSSEITQNDGAKDIPKGNENSTANNEFLEDGYPTTSIVSKDVEQIDKDIKAETIITETGTALSALSIAGVQCGQEENKSEDNKVMETETSLAFEVQEHGSQQHTNLQESPPSLSDVKDSEWEMAQKQGTDNLQSGDDADADTKALDEGSVAIPNEGNFLDTDSSVNTETKVTAEEKKASQDTGSEFNVREIQEPQKTVEAVPGVKGLKNEQGEIKYEDSDDLKINSSTLGTDKVSPSDILHHSTSDEGQRAVGQETQIVEQEPGIGMAIEAVPEGKGNNTEEDETKEDVFSVLKENSSIVAMDKVTPVNILQGSTTDAALRCTNEEDPQSGLDEASLKEMEAGPASTTDKLRGLKADQIDNANFGSSVGSNKIPELQHRDSSESSQAEGEKRETSKPEKGEKCQNEETPKLIEVSESTEMDNPSLSRLLQEPVKEVSKVVDHLIDIKEPITQKEEPQAEKSDKAEHVEAKTDEEKDCEEESGEHQISDLSSDTPVMVDAADKDVKVAHKKSHNILSGVGSKVKHSISKVRKAITGKSSHPKSASPKSSEKYKEPVC